MVDLWTDYYCDGYLIPYEFSQDPQEKLRDTRQWKAATKVKKALEAAKRHLEETTEIRLVPVDEFLQKTQLEDAFNNDFIKFHNCDPQKHMCHKISFANTGDYSCSSLVGKKRANDGTQNKSRSEVLS